MSRILRKLYEYLAFPAFLIGLWQLLLAGSTNPFFVTPLRIISSSKLIFTSEWIHLYLLPTALTFIVGLTLGWAVGILLGSLFAINEKVKEVFLPIINFIRNIPNVAKAPLFIAIIGIGYATRITTVTLAVLFPVLITTMRALGQTDRHLKEYSDLLGYGRMKRLLIIELPAASGEIFTGLQASIQVGIIVTLVSEMLGAGRGLGAFMIRSQSTFMITNLWLCLVVIGLSGLILNQVFLYSEKRIIPWYFKSRARDE